MHSKVYSLDFLRKSFGTSCRIPPALRAVNNSPPEGGVRPPCALRLLASRPRLRRSRAWGLQPPDPLGFAPCAAFASRAPFTRRHREGLLQAVWLFSSQEIFIRSAAGPPKRRGGVWGGMPPSDSGGVGNWCQGWATAGCPCLVPVVHAAAGHRALRARPLPTASEFVGSRRNARKRLYILKRPNILKNRPPPSCNPHGHWLSRELLYKSSSAPDCTT